MLDVFDPYSLGEIASCLERAEREVGELFASCPPESFVAAPEPGVWSPGEHLAHLVLSSRAVERALGVPRPLLWLRFGPAHRASRRYVEVRDAYRAALARGGRASGGFIPRLVDAASPATTQREALARWHHTSAALLVRLRAWDEASLDRIRLPHPLLGKMTVREILLFTLYHDLHHRDAVRRRMPATLPGE